MGQMSRLGTVVLLLGGLIAPARPVMAQRPLTAAGDRILDFSNVFPGVPAVVVRTDALRSGAFSLRGTRDAEVQITFTLPAALIGPGALQIPLMFGPGDGGYSTLNTIGNATAFDPRVPLVARLSRNGRFYVWLGSTALPSSTQPAGTYNATVTLMAAYTGN